jgi:hypothetical protein
MGFPMEVVGVGNKKITERIHIKYFKIMNLKYETYGMGGKISKFRLFQKK